MNGPLRLALLGRHISHSLSPTLHRAGLAALGLNGDYQLLDCPQDSDAEEVIAKLRGGALHGLNVTTPYKGLAARAAEVFVRWESGRWCPTQAPLSSVNTLMVDESGRLLGASTDGAGLGAAMGSAGVTLPAGPGVILGAGGVADALIAWLAETGRAPRWLCNRSHASARGLVARHGAAIEVVDWSSPEVMSDAAWVIHATSAGHAGDLDGGVRALAHLPWAAWAEATLLIDVVYGGDRTAAQRSATRAGARLTSEGGGVWLGSGEAMLAGQAALSLGLWTGREPPVAAMRAALQLTS